MRKFLTERDNLLDKKMMTLTQRKFKFYDALDLKNLEIELVSMYAQYFTDGNNKAARAIIKCDHGDRIRKKDLSVLSLTAGALLVLLPIMAFVYYGNLSR